MGHGSEVYFPRGMNELGDFGGTGGLDKIWRVALGVVQTGFWVHSNVRLKRISSVTEPNGTPPRLDPYGLFLQLPAIIRQVR